MNDPSPMIWAQAQRLSCLDKWPFEDAGQVELARALETAAGDSATFAEKIISAFCADGGRCPDPRQIMQRAYDLTHSGTNVRNACATCGGTGFVHFQKMKKQWCVVREDLIRTGEKWARIVKGDDGKEIMREEMVPNEYARLCHCHATRSDNG